MTNPIIRIVNVTTGEEINRPMNKDELALYKEDQVKEAAEAKDKAAKAEARLAAEGKLLELGLTVDDLKALLG